MIGTRLLSSVLLVLGLAALPGCGGTRSQSGDELARARQAVQDALDVWKKGEPASRLQALQPSIAMTDEAWQTGHRLLDYSVQKTEGDQGDNARCWVVLRLQDRKGKQAEKETVYAVKAGHPIVIARDPFY